MFDKALDKDQAIMTAAELIPEVRADKQMVRYLVDKIIEGAKENVRLLEGIRLSVESERQKETPEE